MIVSTRKAFRMLIEPAIVPIIAIALISPGFSFTFV
jgi:hypothetical protein